MTASIARPAVGCEASYAAFSFPFEVASPSPEVAAAVDFIYREMRAPRAHGSTPLRIEIRKRNEILELSFDGVTTASGGLGDILHQLDNELTIFLERARPRLYFVHAAVLAEDGRGTLLVGESGAGKSTTSYALAASGMGYLSDEMAAIEPETGRIHPYPRAICLKGDPPPPLRLPPGCLRTEWTVHVSPAALSAPIVKEPVSLDRALFVRYSPANRQPALRPLSRAEAAARLYQGALNQLVHPGLGLDVTLELAARARCFELLSAGIEETVRLIRQPAAP